MSCRFVYVTGGAMFKNTKKVIVAVCVFLTVSAISFAEEPPAEYVDFVMGSVQDKTIILQDISEKYSFAYESSPAVFKTMPLEAVTFVVTAVQNVGVQQSLIDLALVAVPLYPVQNQGDIALLWSLFKQVPSKELYVKIFDKLLELPENSKLLYNYSEDMYAFVLEDINSGLANKEASLLATEIMGRINKSTSFKNLFNLYLANTDEDLNTVIEASLLKTLPVSETVSLSLMEDTSVSVREKLSFFYLVQSSPEISDIFKSDLAEKLLSIATINVGDSEEARAELIELQFATLHRLSSSLWVKAMDTVVDFFPIARSEYEQGLISAEQFVDVLYCLQNFATNGSVAVLNGYLKDLNSAASTDMSSVDENVVMAVITGLGALGSKEAFDNLLYVTYLPYSEKVRTAARDAMAMLQW